MRSPAVACLLALALACLAPSAARGQAQDARALLAAAESKRFSEDWYGAIEDYLAAVAKNPSYSEALVGLAECYYALEEYDQALSYVKKAAPLRRGDSALQDLEGFVRIGLSDLAGARNLFTAVQASKPNDLDARFGLALLDLASGRKTEAKARLEDSLRLSPQNARALLSLALIAADQGRKEDAAGLIERALRFHGSDPKVQYTAARLAAASGDVEKAIFHARNAIQQSPAYAEARRLLGALLFGSGSVADAIAIMQEGVARDRKDPAAWFTLGLAQEAAGKAQDAIWSLRQAVALKVDDEVARIALEDLVMDSTPLESVAREPYADWHFDRGGEFEDRSYFDAAMVEYRRGLALNPDSKRGRVLYADLLRKRGLPGRQLAQLRFLDGIGGADTQVRDSIEALDSLLQDSVSRSWRVDQYALPKRHYRVAFFCMAGSPAAGVTEGGHASFTPIMLRYLEDFLGASSRLDVLDLPAGVSGPSEAFRRGREAGADYYVLFSASESGRDVQLGAEIHVARTGSLAASHSAYRTGNDRVKEATSRLAGLIESSFAAKGILLRRSQERGLVDLGSQDGLKVGDRLLIVRKGELSILPEGLGPSWAKDSVVGELTVTAIDEELCEGIVKPSSFFDTVNPGDEVIPAPPQAPAAGSPAGTAGKAPPAAAASPAQPPLLFSAVRRLR
jgi:tetratricopeptide (TPR) repeat protein